MSESHSLAPGEIHVHHADADDSSPADDALRDTLSVTELARAARFHFDRDRRMFIVGRALCRIRLGEYLALPPAEVPIELLPHGKPALAAGQNPDRIEFNVAHSGGLVVLAFSRGIRVGIDVEWTGREVGDRDAIARRHFAPGEVARYLALPDDQKPQAFLDCWTRKEAFVKALGDGLSVPLADFEVEFAPGKSARLLATRGRACQENNWSLWSWTPEPGFTAALAAEGRDITLKILGKFSLPRA